MDTRIYHELYRLERDYWWHKAKRRLVLQTLIKRQKGQNHIRVLDAGCGTGIMLSEMQEIFPNSFGVDKSVLALKFSKKRGLKNLHRGNLEKTLLFKKNSFDVITCLDVIEHLDKDRVAVEELLRVLKPGGRLLITVPAYMTLWTHHDEMLWHKRRYRRSQLKKLLTGAGFQVKNASYFYSFIAPLAFVMYKMKFMFNSRRSNSSIIPPRPINWLMFRICRIEQWVMNFVPLPFGISIFLEAVKDRDSR